MLAEVRSVDVTKNNVWGVWGVFSSVICVRAPPSHRLLRKAAAPPTQSSPEGFVPVRCLMNKSSDQRISMDIRSAFGRYAATWIRKGDLRGVMMRWSASVPLNPLMGPAFC